MAQTVLLVDDHRSVRAAVKTVLDRVWHAVLEAPSGARAVEIANGHPGPIDLLLAEPFAAADLRDALDKVSAVQERPPPDPAAGTPHSSG